MATLISPGVSITVTDDTLVAGAGNGTVPLYVFASAQDKYVPNSTTIATGTKASNAEKLYLLTSQKDVLETFGAPIFQESNGSVVQGDELNEYGLHGLYSYMGIANRAYAVRANLDMNQLVPTAIEPTGPVLNNTLWLNTKTSIIEAYVPKLNPPAGTPFDAWELRTAHVRVGEYTVGEVVGKIFAPEVLADPDIKIGDIVLIYTYTKPGHPDSAFRFVIRTIDGVELYNDAEVVLSPKNEVPDASSYKLWVRTGFTTVGSKHFGTRLDGYIYNSLTDTWKNTVLYFGKDSADAESITGTHINNISIVQQTTNGGNTTKNEFVGYVGTVLSSGYQAADISCSVVIGRTIGNGITLAVDYLGKSKKIFIPSVISAGDNQVAADTKYLAAIYNALSTDLELINAGFRFNNSSETHLYVTNINGYAAKFYQSDLSVETADWALRNTVVLAGHMVPMSSKYQNFFVRATAPVGQAPEGTYWFKFEPSNNLDVGLYRAQHNPDGTSSWNDIVKAGLVLISTEYETGFDYWVKPLKQGTEGYEFYKVIDGEVIKLDTTDQTTTNGILFGDIDTIGSASLYMTGMVLCNLKETEGVVLQMKNGKWEIASGVNTDGSGVFGRFAQRKIVVEKLADAIVSNDEIRAEYVDFNLMTVPGYVELLDEMISLNTDRRETAFIVTDVPPRLAPTGTNIQNWATNANNAADNGENGRITRYAYAAQYAGWCYGTNLDGKSVAIPGSTVAMRTYAYNDSVSYVWMPPAGTNRGVVTNATSVGYINPENEYQPVLYTRGQLDTLYSNSINAIEMRSNRGLVIMGDKTLESTGTAALSRVNVARLVVYIRRQIELLADNFKFKLNTASTRQEFAGALNALLANIVQLEGLYDFQVVCDESNNTSSRIDNNELWADIAIQPTKSINFIYVPIRIQNTGS